MNGNQLKKFFNIICIVELFGCFLLFCIAMPLKYGFNNPDFIRPFGMFHGLVFITYVILATKVKNHLNWSRKEFGTVILYAILPFFSWFVHKKLKAVNA